MSALASAVPSRIFYADAKTAVDSVNYPFATPPAGGHIERLSTHLAMWRKPGIASQLGFSKPN